MAQSVWELGVKTFYEYKEFLNNRDFTANFSHDAVASYSWNERSKIYFGFESPENVEEKLAYAVQTQLGGVMLWAIDYDDKNLTMLQLITRNRTAVNLRSFDSNCTDFAPGPQFRHGANRDQQKTWWTWKDGSDKSGHCGPDAPRLNGSEATCDPWSSDAFCCSAYGYCGSGPDYCQCTGCKNYAV